MRPNDAFERTVNEKTLYGVYTISRHARDLFLALIAFHMLMTLLGGMYVTTPVSSVVIGFLGLIQGGLIALAYLSPLRERFH